MSNEVMAPATAAATVTMRITGPQLPVTVSASGLGAAEEITIKHKRGDSWEDSGEVISADVPQRLILGPGDWQLSKDDTAAAVGLYIDGDANIPAP